MPLRSLISLSVQPLCARSAFRSPPSVVCSAFLSIRAMEILCLTIFRLGHYGPDQARLLDGNLAAEAARGKRPNVEKVRGINALIQICPGGPSRAGRPRRRRAAGEPAGAAGDH